MVMDENGRRVPVRVNPVTGKMEAVKPKKEDSGKVREGCMMIDRKYLQAATDAGLGSSNGMYSHLSGVRRTLGSSKNIGGSSGGGGARRHPKKHEPVTKMTKVGGVKVHQISTSSKSSAPAPARRSNIKRVVQGRSRSISNNGKSRISDQGASAFSKQKGVVNTFGGSKNIRRTASSSKNASGTNKKTGIATFGSSGGRSFIKSEKKKVGAHISKAAQEQRGKNPAHSNSSEPQRKPAIVRKLGGGGGGATGGGRAPNDGMSDRERRAQFFAKKFGK